jgi:hypothetical protein
MNEWREGGKEEEKGDFRTSRRIVMKKTWERLKKAEKEGHPITHAAFRQIQEEEWKKLKKKTN